MKALEEEISSIDVSVLSCFGLIIPVVSLFEGRYNQSAQGTGPCQRSTCALGISHKKDVKRITKGCRNIAQFIEMVDDNYAIIQVGDSVSMYAPVLAFVSRFPLTCSTLNKDLLKPGCSVCVHPGSSAVVDILPPQADNDIKIMTEKPTVTYQDIGGLDIQKQELRESVELPLLHPEIFAQIGIDPPRGVRDADDA